MEEQQQTVESPKSGSSTKMIISAVVVVVVILVAVIGYQAMGKKTVVTEEKVVKEDVKGQEVTNQDQQMGTEAAKMTSTYKNGVYTEMGDYISPGGAEQIKVSLTLTDGKITDAVVTPQATRPMSKVKQADFTANFKEFVIGKNIDEVMLTKVSGSSLTPKGFNDAVEKIKAKAKA